jgi:uncharacterized protein YcbX
MLQLSEIWIYPIKSLGGISLKEAKITDRGLEHDRRWLLVDENGLFLSQRECSELALFQPEINGNSLIITHRIKQEVVHISLNQTFSKATSKTNVKVWDDTIEAHEVDEEISNWFSKMLDCSVRLVYMPEESHRKVEPDFSKTGNEINSFSDGFPFLLIGQSSLDDLNSRLKQAVSMNRFRPNFVFVNGDAYEEEAWDEFKIGQVTFYGVKPCGRCVITTIDQELGVKSGKDPLFTLSKYKKIGDRVIFGQNLISTQLGEVRIGDEIIILNRKKEPVI